MAASGSHSLALRQPTKDAIIEGDRRPVRCVGIIGAGVMGRGIAAANARAGMAVSICDVNAAKAEEAVQEILATCRTRAVSSPQALSSARRPSVSIARSDADFKSADLVIEAVSEDWPAKMAVLSRVEPHLHASTIIASNSSSIPIARVAGACQNPSRVCGLHFCHPVHARPLVEVVAADSTSAETLSRAYRYALSLGMSPIVVKDGPGFLLNRLLVAYMNEALELLLDGADVEQLDRAAEQFGMPLGPLAHFDEFGIDVAIAVGRSLYRAFPDRIVPSELLVAMYKAGRLGRKTGCGFYRTKEKTAEGELEASVADMIRERRRGIRRLSQEDVNRRLLLPMLLEATRCLEESLVDGPEIIERALRDGLGMTESYRGLFGWADAVGIARILQWLEPLRALGKRFEPTEMLIRMSAIDASLRSAA